MPTVEQVVAKTGGENASNTAARRWVAFDKLSLLTDKLLRIACWRERVSLRRAAIRDRYGVNRDSIAGQQQTTLTAARFSEWRKLADRYSADPHFNNTLLTLFSPGFRAAYKQVLRETFEGAAIPGATAPGEPRGRGRDNVFRRHSRKAHVPPGALGGLGIRLLLQRARLELDPRDPFRLLLGGDTSCRITRRLGGQGVEDRYDGRTGAEAARRLRLRHEHQDLQHDNDPRPVLPPPGERDRRVDQARGVGLPVRGRSHRLGRLGGARGSRRRPSSSSSTTRPRTPAPRRRS